MNIGKKNNNLRKKKKNKKKKINEKVDEWNEMSERGGEDL